MSVLGERGERKELGDISCGHQTVSCSLRCIGMKHQHILKVGYSTYCPAMNTGIGFINPDNTPKRVYTTTTTILY